MHPSHKTRFSDSSLYDAVCVNCGVTDTQRASASPCPKAPAKPRGLPADPPAEWIEAMARAIDPHGCNWENQLTGPLKDFARQQARAAYAALARAMGGRDG